MARPTADSIDTFMRITGASESHAVRKLEEYGGNLDEAINAHFGEVERNLTNPLSTASPHNDFVNTRNQTQDGSRGILPLLSAARSFKPSLLLDPSYRRNLLNQIGSSVFTSREPLYTQTGRFNNGYQQPYHSGPMPALEHADGTSLSHDHQFHGNVSRVHETNLHGNDIEEQMIQFAIEASKQEELSGHQQRHSHLADDELYHAISLSLKTAKQEEAIRELTLEDQKQLVVRNSTGRAEKTNDSRWQPGSSSFQGGAEDFHEQSLWGGISSKELDEAILLEAAIFAETSEGTSYQRAPQPPTTPDKIKGPYPQKVHCRPSPSVVEQRLLWEQQDDEYLASLLADREKEMNALKERETSYVKEGESPNKMLDEKAEFERLLAAKEASLPQEPAVNDENAVTLLVRMPDGSRCSRSFLKSDKLQFLFDFIDIGRTVKPGTYRVMRPFPRHPFSAGDSSLSLKELGLTNKQEALFLELI
ncbi:plant UBX domain-containing protein 8 isoform X1 [Ricinus communis]|uniref:plant UBX domain-containing protein 8 isoform X1 n=1 Tax=Ricinus communis TaxID=3988 RepID=UPI00201ADBB9|nr:plant UBX domain-containing protein 8 isoform X1 [Ricinus communis]